MARESGAHSQLADAYAALGRKPEAVKQRQVAAKLMKSVKPLDNGGPNPGESAPEFSLPRLGDDSAISMAQFRSGKPAVLLFGSYTCPTFANKLPPSIHSRISIA